MEKVKVVKINSEEVVFDNGSVLGSSHESDCCEHHYLSFEDVEMTDFEGLEFNLTNGQFFRRIEGYGIELIPIRGFSVRVAGYGDNNGYYSSDLELVLTHEGETKRSYDITECQDY